MQSKNLLQLLWHSDETGEEEDDDDMAGAPQAESDKTNDVLTSLTRRLRCIFSVVTRPILPLASLSVLGLIWLLYASFVLDINKSCLHPLHWYSGSSVIFLLYLPFHASIRFYFFNYDRDRDGSNRPVSIRRYDQCLNTVGLIYVYAGITIVQTCRDDLIMPDGTEANVGSNLDMATLNNTCAATCPNTFASLRVYITCLELFVLSLIVPLLFLPCIYIYFLRRTVQDAETLSMLQDRLNEEEAVRRNGGITAEEILKEFEIVHLVADPRTIERKVLVVPQPSETKDTPQGTSSSTGSSASSASSSQINFAKAMECDTKECCICMKNFKIRTVSDIEAGVQCCDNNPEDRVVRTSQTCNHLFHQRCIASWVGGRWEADSNGEPRPARHTTCPLCRRDFRPNR